MGDETHTEGPGEFSRLLDEKDFGKDESVALRSLPSGGNSEQHPKSVRLSIGESEPLKDKIIELGEDRVRLTLFQKCFNRLFGVVGRGEHEALSTLLANNVTNVNTIDRQGNTALHHAVALACRKGDRKESLYKCIDLLMSCEQMNVNMPNKKGYTAIGYALNALDRTCIEHMLSHPSADRLHLDYCPGDRQSTVREIIVDNYPDLQPRLPAHLMERLDSTDRDIKLLAALQLNKYNIFSDNLSPTNPNPWYNEPYHSSLIELACQRKNRKEFVEILLHKRADPNIKNRVTGMPLLHATARSGNFEVLQLLLEKDGIDASHKDNEKRTILHWLAGVSEEKPGDKEKIEECFKPLLKSNYIRKKGIDDRDSLGHTPLYIAVEKEFWDRAKIFLTEGADVRVFEGGSKILSHSVSIVENIFDGSLQLNDKPPTSMDLQLQLKYQSFRNIVPRITESEHHMHLLTHPVISTFLNIRWEQVKFLYYRYLALYVIFVVFLTAYILLSETYNTQNNGRANSNTTDTFSSNDSNKTSGINESNFTSQPNSSSLRLLQIFLMISLFLLTLTEMRQLFVHRWKYIQSLENCLELLLIISTFISCFGVVESAEVKLHFSAFALLLGWSELFILSGRMPSLSVQLEMLRRVSKTFLSYIVRYATLLIAVAFSFRILFKGRSEQDVPKMFANIPGSLSKTIDKFAGEFGVSDLPFDTLPYTSDVIFLLFVVLVAIILLNLFNGLAASNARAITKNAKILNLAARAKLISRIEIFVHPLPECIKNFEELKGEIIVMYPNRWNIIDTAALQTIIKKIKGEKPTEILEEWLIFTKKLSELQILPKELRKTLDSMLDKYRQISVPMQTDIDNR